MFQIFKICKIINNTERKSASNILYDPKFKVWCSSSIRQAPFCTKLTYIMWQYLTEVTEFFILLGLYLLNDFLFSLEELKKGWRRSSLKQVFCKMSYRATFRGKLWISAIQDNKTRNVVLRISGLIANFIPRKELRNQKT